MSSLGNISNDIARAKPISIEQLAKFVDTGETVSFTMKHPGLVGTRNGLDPASLFELYIIRLSYGRGAKFNYFLYPHTVTLKDNESGIQVSFASAAPRYMDNIESGEIHSLIDRHLQFPLGMTIGLAYQRKAVRNDSPIDLVGALSKTSTGYHIAAPTHADRSFSDPIISAKTSSQMVAQENKQTEFSSVSLTWIFLPGLLLSALLLLVNRFSSENSTGLSTKPLAPKNIDRTH